MGILIHDMVMGSSKTNNIIKYINERTDKSRPLLIIVPLKSEIERFINNCQNENFKTPKSFYSLKEKRKINKQENLFSLLCCGNSIVTTHSLFNLFSEEIEVEIERQEYIIIIDEEVVTIEPLVMSKDERILLFEDSKYAKINPMTKRVEWIGPRHEKFEVDKNILHYRKIIMTDRVISFDGSTGDLFVVETPVSFFSLSDKYIILTYMFESSDLCSFFKMYDIKYSILYQDKKEEEKYKENFRRLITLVDPPKSIQKLADKRKTNFSSTHWDSNRISTEFMITLRDTLGKYLKRNEISKDELLYACKKNLSSQEENNIQGRHLTPKGYSGCWIPYNCKATNDYSDKTFIIYMHNVYRNVHVSKYLKSKVGCGSLCDRTKEENDQYSLSIMLQCLWRIAIRNDEPIRIMIFSNRMKSLLQGWLED